MFLRLTRDKRNFRVLELWNFRKEQTKTNLLTFKTKFMENTFSTPPNGGREYKMKIDDLAFEFAKGDFYKFPV